MPRGPILLVPLEIIKELVLTNDKNAFERDTIDIFVRFDEEKILVVYKNSELDITSNSVLSYNK